MSLLGLELNSTYLHAVRGALGEYPATEPIDPPHSGLPMVVSLEGRGAQFGSIALASSRKSPQFVYHNFLPRLGATPSNGICADPRGKLSPAKALSLVFQHVMKVCRESDGVVLSLPAYLTARQVETVLTVADQAGLPVLGSISAPLAAALSAHAEHSWIGTAVVVDVDNYAMTLTAIGGEKDSAQVLDTRLLPHLSESEWRERLLNAIADCFVLESRWDPRESADGEQSLFDQLGEVLDACQQGRIAKVAVRAPGRFQSLVLQPHDAGGFCSILRRLALAELEQFLSLPSPDSPPPVLLLTAAAARLPGLTSGLESCLPRWQPNAVRKTKTTLSALEDFGSGLVDAGQCGLDGVTILCAGAAARGAHSVSGYFQRGDIAGGHLQAAAPLPLPLPPEAGPARLHFQGKDYLLEAKLFAIGRHPDADLVFDTDQWPHVAPRHCEIVYDRRRYMLCDRSRQGTLVNDRETTQAVPLRPGDWIRLGPNGPLLRFLGNR